MGTSKGYQAPSTPQWRQVKLEVTLASKAGNISEPKAQEILSSFVRANGGSQGMSGGDGGSGGGSLAARRIGKNLARFAGVVGSSGLGEALEQFGLGHLVGKSAREFTLTLLNELCDDGGTFDEVDARKAMSDLTNDLLEDATTYEQVVQKLEEKMQPESLGTLLFQFFGHYIYSRFCRVFYERLVRKYGDAVASGFLIDIRDVIFALLEHKTYKRDITNISWSGSEGTTIIQDILQVTLEAFER